MSYASPEKKFKSIRKHAVTTVMDLGAPDEQAAHHRPPGKRARPYAEALAKRSRNTVVPAPVTTNTISVTQRAQRIFWQNADDLSKVRDTVFSATCQLTNSGTDPVSTNQLTAALQQWSAALDDIISMSYWMSDTLGSTWRQIEKNEQDNTDLASGLTVQAEPRMLLLSRLNAADDKMVAPGQTVGFKVALEDRPAPTFAASRQVFRSRGPT